jgi:hypothetical protein
MHDCLMTFTTKTSYTTTGDRFESFIFCLIWEGGQSPAINARKQGGRGGESVRLVLADKYTEQKLRVRLSFAGGRCSLHSSLIACFLGRGATFCLFSLFWELDTRYTTVRHTRRLYWEDVAPYFVLSTCIRGIAMDAN